jgi:hypothetical protein
MLLLEIFFFPEIVEQWIKYCHSANSIYWPLEYFLLLKWAFIQYLPCALFGLFFLGCLVCIGFRRVLVIRSAFFPILAQLLFLVLGSSIMITIHMSLLFMKLVGRRLYTRILTFFLFLMGQKVVEVPRGVSCLVQCFSSKLFSIKILQRFWHNFGLWIIFWEVYSLC